MEKWPGAGSDLSLMGPSVMRSVIILAAGLGSRFGGGPHKGLFPLLGGEGTLCRLLHKLGQIDPDVPIVLVTGHDAEAVASAARGIRAGIACVPNPAYANGSALTSLCAGLRVLDGRAECSAATVLFADTDYSAALLSDMLAGGAEEVAVACQPRAEAEADAIGLGFDPTTRALLDIGPDVAMAQGVMAPAVTWPRSCWPRVIAAEQRGARSQWQVLRDGVPAPVRVLAWADRQARDIDTPADAETLRAVLIGEGAFSYFRSNISKEERNRHNPDYMRGGRFVKVVASVEQAQREASALRWLARVGGEPLVPALLERNGRRLELEQVPGIRLYDLLRLLDRCAQANPECRAVIDKRAATLMARCVGRLARIQRALLDWSQGERLAAYPFDTHVAALFDILLALADLPPLSARGRAEMRALADRWGGQDVAIPFRDATPKNILVALPHLAPDGAGDSAARLDAVMRWVERDAAATVRIVDFDFTSVQHLTAPEDDAISLLAHRGSLGHSGAFLPQGAAWTAAIAGVPHRMGLPFAPDPARAARALLVRYLRFGGRKFLYRMVNPEGYALRFRHDLPGHYFRVLARDLAALDPGFPQDHPEVHDRLGRLDAVASRLGPWRPEERGQDPYLARYGAGLSFWQESPGLAVAHGG